MKKLTALILALATFLCALSGCTSKNPSDETTTAEQLPAATLRIAGSIEDCRAIEWAATQFKKENPNCTVIYEYIQGQYNEALKERMQSDGSSRVDLFITGTNIQEGHVLADYTYDLKTLTDLDLSTTFPSLIENYMFIESDGSPATKLYSVPLGAQMRGLYVNVSLLKDAGINTIPKNQAELLNACAVLKEKGYVPFQGDSSVFAQQLLYPWICNNIVNSGNYEETYNLVNTRSPEAVELFRDVYEFMYKLVENDYYDYNYSQKTLKVCTDSSTETYARSLLNIVEKVDEKGLGTGDYINGDGYGQVAFLPSSLSLTSVIDKMKSDYHNQTEYAFVPAPVGFDGGYVYLSPADAIGINKSTENIEWATKFLNFILKPENNETFAKMFSIIPNTSGAFDYISNLYDVPQNHISELGKATFDWKFYRTLTNAASESIKALPAISKANNPKKFDPETNKMYSFEHFWELFKEEFTSAED